MTQIAVLEGDITRVRADALLTVVNAGGAWFGGIDDAIQRVAGNTFHSQIDQEQPLRDGDAFYARAVGDHSVAFQSVIFVIDELEQPIENVVLTGLELAVDNGLKTVTIPTIRTGVMRGLRETHKEALRGLIKAAKTYADSDALEKITIVVYNSPSDATFLRQTLGIQA